MLVSGVQQSDSDIHISISILFQILFPYRLLQDIEYSSLYCTVGSLLVVLFLILDWCVAIAADFNYIYLPPN